MRSLSRILLAGAVLSGFTCQTASLNAPVDEIPATAVDESFGEAGVRHLAHDFVTGFTTPSRSVIRDLESWRTAWALYNGPRLGMIPLPAVDFSRSTIILVASGTHGTGGFDITVSRVATDAGTVYAQVTSTSPGDRCGTTQALTQPVDIVVVPHLVERAVFVERKEISNC